MLTELAEELAPQYEGELIVKQYHHGIEPWDPAGPSFLYIEQCLHSEKKILGFIPWIAHRKEIVRVSESLDKDVIYAKILDNGATDLTREYIRGFMKEQGISRLETEKPPELLFCELVDKPVYLNAWK
jgi:hypothetical protein|tara:strand:- start:2233 stop:2616 length:384 start_codon:yes stop_codon:yes gene_type:complete